VPHPFTLFAKGWESTNLNPLVHKEQYGSASARTQSLVGQMGWVFERPLLTAIEVLWRWTFGIPFVIVTLLEAIKILVALPPASSGLSSLDPRTPGSRPCNSATPGALSASHPRNSALASAVAAFAWVVVSALGRSLLLKQMKPALRFRPLAMIVLQAAWLALFLFTCYCWLRSMQWVAAATITPPPSQT